MLISINEIFGDTKQGEGRSVGMKVSFVRTGFCNLQCVWCDTPYTWNWQGSSFVHVKPEKFDIADEVHKMSVTDVIAQLMKYEARAVVISGGEPCLQHKQLVPLIAELQRLGFWVEIETNGTLYPDTMFALVDQINCSPKLASSGNEASKAIKQDVLKKLALLEKATFKFVISSNEDEQEVISLVDACGIKPDSVYLMPQGMTVEELNLTRATTQELASRLGFNFSDRIHITELGGGRGV